jgi:hypothetical protein
VYGNAVGHERDGSRDLISVVHPATEVDARAHTAEEIESSAENDIKLSWIRLACWHLRLRKGCERLILQVAPHCTQLLSCAVRSQSNEILV